MALEETIFIPAAEVRGELAADTKTPGQPVPPSQPQPGSDSRLAAILQKKSAGEKLSAADRGYLGAVKRRGSPKTVAAAASENLLLQVEANPDNALFEDEALAATPAAAAGHTAIDSARLRKTAGALLDGLDLGTKIYVGYEAKSAGADKQSVDQWKSAVALQPGNRELMLEGSDPIVLWLCEKFKCTPEQLENVLKGSGFIGGAFLHIVAVVTAVKSIHESKQERQSQQPEQKS